MLNLSVVSGRLGMEGLETVEGSGSESSDDDSEEAPGTSGMSFHAPKHGSDGVEVAAEVPRSCRRARGLSADCSSRGKLQTPVTGSRNGSSEDLCAEPGERSPQASVERKRATETKTEKTQETKEAGSQDLMEKEAAGAGLKKEEETKEMTDGEGAARGAPGEDRENAPVAKLEGSQSGNTVSDSEGSLSKAKSI